MSTPSAPVVVVLVVLVWRRRLVAVVVDLVGLLRCTVGLPLSGLQLRSPWVLAVLAVLAVLRARVLGTQVVQGVLHNFRMGLY
jgi:hypothetical protein